MRITVIAGSVLLACLTAAAQAQVYCWNTKDGKRQCGDTPPPGVKTTVISAPAPSTPTPASAGAGSKDAKKGPLTPAQQEQAFRKRQIEAAKTQEKEEKTRQEAETRKADCERARDSLRALESGQRISRIDNQGERYYLDEQQIAHEAERAREIVQKTCN